MRRLTDAQYTAIIAAINSQKHDRAAYLKAATKIRLGFGGAYGINADIPSSMNEWRSDKDKSIRLIEQYQSACDKAKSAFLGAVKPAGSNEVGVGQIGIEAIEQQRDELLAALERLLEGTMSMPNRGRATEGKWTTINALTSSVDSAKAAIAAAKGVNNEQNIPD